MGKRTESGNSQTSRTERVSEVRLEWYHGCERAWETVKRFRDHCDSHTKWPLHYGLGQRFSDVSMHQNDLKDLLKQNLGPTISDSIGLDGVQ